MQMQHFEPLENTQTRARDRLVEKARLKKKTQHYRAAEHRNRKEKLQLEVNIFDLLSSRKTNKHNIDQDIARFTEVQRRFFAQVSQRASYVSPEFSTKYSVLPPLTSRRTILKIIKDTLGEKMEELNEKELEVVTEVGKNELEDREAPIMNPEDLRIFRTARERRNSRLASLTVPSITVEDEETNDSETKEQCNDDEIQLQIPEIRVRRPTGSVSGGSERYCDGGEKKENFEKSSKKREENEEESDSEKADVEDDDVISSVADENDKLVHQKQEEMITNTTEEHELGNSSTKPKNAKTHDEHNIEEPPNLKTAPKMDTLVPPLNLATVKPNENQSKSASTRTRSPSMINVPAYEDYNMITKRKVKQSRHVKMPPCLMTKSEWNLVQDEERSRRFSELKMRHQEQYRSHVEAMKRWLALPPIKT